LTRPEAASPLTARLLINLPGEPRHLVELPEALKPPVLLVAVAFN
jgi:hypothetical protein